VIQLRPSALAQPEGSELVIIRIIIVYKRKLNLSSDEDNY